MHPLTIDVVAKHPQMRSCFDKEKLILKNKKGRRNEHKTFAKCFAILAVLGLLAACGGGGGSGST